MAVFKMQESKFGAPKGIYIGKFLGIQPMKNDGKPRLGKDGKPMPDGVEWQFEISEGDYAGKIVGRITSAMPTTKNSCGTLLMGLCGKALTANDEIDANDYVGHIYQIVVGPSRDNPEKTQVTEIFRKGQAPAKTPSSSATPPPPNRSTAAPPPPRKVAPPAPRADQRSFWVEQLPGIDPVQMDEAFLQDWLIENQKKPAEVPVCQVGTQEWKTAADFGFSDEIPF